MVKPLNPVLQYGVVCLSLSLSIRTRLVRFIILQKRHDLTLPQSL